MESEYSIGLHIQHLNSSTVLIRVQYKAKYFFEICRFSYKIAKPRQGTDNLRIVQSPSYVFVSKVWMNKLLSKDAYSRSQESDKLGVRSFGPFQETKLMVNNALKLYLSDFFKIHLFVLFLHKTLCV